MAVTTETEATVRQKLLEQELERYLHLLTEHDTPERIILYGSLATGQVHAWSDIDLVVIKPTSRPFWQRLREIWQLLEPRVGTDILVYTPQEFAQLCKERPFFQKEILDKGVTLYERGR